MATDREISEQRANIRAAIHSTMSDHFSMIREALVAGEASVVAAQTDRLRRSLTDHIRESEARAENFRQSMANEGEVQAMLNQYCVLATGFMDAMGVEDGMEATMLDALFATEPKHMTAAMLQSKLHKLEDEAILLKTCAVSVSGEIKSVDERLKARKAIDLKEVQARERQGRG